MTRLLEAHGLSKRFGGVLALDSLDLSVAPNNYTFADSLILVSILLIGGIGNPWGLIVATLIVVIVPEKLQTIQEYRFLLYALLVIGVLLFRPQGLLPRPVRRYFPGWRP